VPIEVRPNAVNERYLTTKRERLGHLLHHPTLRRNGSSRSHAKSHPKSRSNGR
jgi:hypothetical protein